MSNRNHIKKIVVIFLCAIVIVGGIVTLVASCTDGSLCMDILSLLATLLGTIFIAVELRNSQVVTCCDMLIQLNNHFHDNSSIMEVYESLEKEYTKHQDVSELWKSINDSHIAAYCTFFENIYLLVRNKIVKMADIDSLFGYRFFLFVHNPYIQEKYILPTSSSYSEIFELYEIWSNYRKKHSENLTVRSEFAFPKEYLKNKLYLCDKGTEKKEVAELTAKNGIKLHIQEATFEDITEVINLQKAVNTKLNNTDIYCPLSREDLLESFHKDLILCVWDENQLAAFAVVVMNRKSDRNLYKHMRSTYSFEDVITFDAVVVDEAYRGNGIQSTLIQETLQRAKKLESVKVVAATVSPNNPHSIDNFNSCDFTNINQITYLD